MGKYLDREGVRHLWKKAVGMFATKATATVLQVVRAANKYVMGTVYYREVAYNTSPGKWYKVDMSKISSIATT